LEKIKQSSAFAVPLQEKYGEECWTEISQSIFERLKVVLDDDPVEEVF
jgi:hypothetical protein